MESFSYILIWASTYYDLEKGERLEPLAASGLQYWGYSDANLAYSAKRYLWDEDGLQSLPTSVHEQWDGVWTDWVVLLYAIFCRGYLEAQLYRLLYKSGPSDFDYDTCGGWITLKSSWTQSIPRGLDPIRS